MTGTAVIDAGRDLTVNANTNNRKVLQSLTITGGGGDIGVAVSIAYANDTTAARVDGHATAGLDAKVLAMENKYGVNNSYFFGLVPTVFSGVQANAGVGNYDTGNTIANVQGAAQTFVGNTLKGWLKLQSNNAQSKQSQRRRSNSRPPWRSTRRTTR